MPLPEGDAVASHLWQLEIEGVSIAQFKEVSGVSSEIGVIEHRENKAKGVSVLKRLPGLVSGGNVTMKRGKTEDKTLWQWFKQVEDGDVAGARKNGSVVLYDYAHGEIARYNFVNAWPSKVSLGALAAGSSDVLVEECTLVHEGLTLA
jgi:phage tail-like protein